MLFYEEVNKSGKIPVGMAVEGSGSALAPLSPMPELGDKLAQLQVTCSALLCSVSGEHSMAIERREGQRTGIPV